MKPDYYVVKWYRFVKIGSEYKQRKIGACAFEAAVNKTRRK